MGKVNEKLSAPAITREEQEDRLIALAYQVSEEQLLSGTASSQIITHFLKLGNRKAELETEQTKLQNKLLEEKILSEKSSVEINKMFVDVMRALKTYTGNPEEDFYANDY